ncbi:hypothetical protein L7F22_056889 [Adiantum nelumboides]|nr:hypothetical protein [Adiantum nelumboides]
MMDVLVNKGFAAPLKNHKEGAYNDDQWEDLDDRARAMIWLHLGESIFFTIMEKTIAFELWDSLCSARDGKNASNNVFLMKKLMHLSMKEGSSVSSHLNEFNALYLQLTLKGLNFDDEMKTIFLLCSLPASWDTLNTAISNSTHGGKLAFGDVTSAPLTEEIRHWSLDSGGHGDRPFSKRLRRFQEIAADASHFLDGQALGVSALKKCKLGKEFLSWLTTFIFFVSEELDLEELCLPRLQVGSFIKDSKEHEVVPMNLVAEGQALQLEYPRGLVEEVEKSIIAAGPSDINMPLPLMDYVMCLQELELSLISF